MYFGLEYIMGTYLRKSGENDKTNKLKLNMIISLKAKVA